MKVKQDNSQTISEGYKQTDIGVLPKEWETYKLVDTSTLKARIGWQGLTTAEYLDSGEYHLITGTDFRDGVIDWKSCCYVSKKRYDQDKNIQVKDGDVLVTKDGTIGKVAFINNLPRKSTLNSGVFVVRPKNNSYDPAFFYNLLRSKYFEFFLNQLAAGSTISHLYQKDFVNFEFPLPTDKNEQSQIAQVLSDLDSLIQKTEKLIEKKRIIRKGLIHNLLSGIQRLHGFKHDWSTEKLTDLCWFQEGPGVRTSQFTNSGVKLLNGTNINKNQLNLDTTERYIPSKLANGAYAHFLADNDDIVIASSGISVEKFDEKVAFVEKKDLPLCMNTSTIRFKSYPNKISKGYLFYFLQSDSFKKHIGEQATGSAQLNFGPYHLNRLFVHLPKDIDEQTAIAETLSFVDSDIHLLEKKLVKYNQIKQGAMQVLLTGKIRLNPNSYAKPITQSRAN